MADPEAVLTIGEVAHRAGIRASRIRCYESIGVLPAADRVSGKRRYTPAVLRRKLPEIDQLIQRALTVRELLVTCAVCDCESLDQCRILDDALALDDLRSGRPTAHARDPNPPRHAPPSTTRRDPRVTHGDLGA
jgi:DNA-binding transcriptional MerR regulator